ncbi:MAG TPA: DinB family protein [Cytophagales bacterium]|nr:DinB family protein [Cytophagales bacterium]
MNFSTEQISLKRTKALSNEIAETFTELINLISSFDQGQVNIIPFQGSWTAGQLARHLIKANSGFVQVLNGPAMDSKRRIDEKVETIKTDFLNFGFKVESAPFIAPSKPTYEREELLNALEKIKADLIKAIDLLDLTKICLAFELPVYGFLTRLEAVYFVLYHTQRHVHQLKNIHQKVFSR